MTMIQNIRTHYEITVSDPLTDNEMYWVIEQGEREGYNISVSDSRRIVLAEGFEDGIREVISFMADYQFIHDVGLIKEITEYEPVYEEDVDVFDDFNWHSDC